MGKPKVLSEKVVYESLLTKVISAKVQLANGNLVEWDYIDNANGVVVLPVDKDNNVYLCKEWRPAWKDYIIQAPAGSCVTEDEEVRVKQVHNELVEEIGLDARRVEKLISILGTGRINYVAHIYLALDLYKTKKDIQENELLEIVKMPFEEAYQMFISGKTLTTGYTLIAFLMAKQKLGL